MLGVGKDEIFLASDVSAIVAYTRDAVDVNDFDRSRSSATNSNQFPAGERGDHAISKVDSSPKTSKKGITGITC